MPLKLNKKFMKDLKRDDLEEIPTLMLILMTITMLSIIVLAIWSRKKKRKYKSLLFSTTIRMDIHARIITIQISTGTILISSKPEIFLTPITQETPLKAFKITLTIVILANSCTRQWSVWQLVRHVIWVRLVKPV